MAIAATRHRGPTPRRVVLVAVVPTAVVALRIAVAGPMVAVVAAAPTAVVAAGRMAAVDITKVQF